jgi:hypothetical protein
LQSACISNVRKCATAGKLRNHPKLKTILFFWKKWDNTTEPSRWIENLISTKEGLKIFLRAFFDKVLSSRAPSGDEVTVAVGMMEDVCPLQLISNRIDEFGLILEKNALAPTTVETHVASAARNSPRAPASATR